MEPEYESLANGLRPCVYCLVYKGKVMYVGQSSQPLSRFYQHVKTKKMMKTPFGPRVVKAIPFDDMWVKPCMAWEIDAEEIRLIHKYRPKFNVKHNEDDVDVEKIDFKALVQSLAPDKFDRVHPYVVGKINRRI